MKNLFINASRLWALIACTASLMWLCGCTEEERGQFPIDSTPPQQVSNLVVTNLPGGATITYQLPDERDLLYVKAIYQLPDGSTQEVKSSVFSNSLTIKGYGRSVVTKIKLVSVDRSQNESEPIEVEIHPEDSPIYDILESLNITEDWGGLNLKWENPLEENIVLSVNRQNEDGVYENLETYYSSVQNVQQSVRGLESVPTNLIIYVRDSYNNSTDTLKVTKTPWYEILLDNSRFTPIPVSANLNQNTSSNGTMPVLWDGITMYSFIDKALFTISPATAYVPYFSLDLGVTAKLTHFRFWSRENYFYRLRHSHYVQLFGTNDEAVAKNPESPDSDWIMLTAPPYYESIRPSGKGLATAIMEPGDEDYDYAIQGEEITFPMDVPAIRYFRFKSLETWTGTKEIQLVEIRFWGDPR
jgi:hypothetical protein